MSEPKEWAKKSERISILKFKTEAPKLIKLKDGIIARIKKKAKFPGKTIISGLLITALKFLKKSLIVVLALTILLFNFTYRFLFYFSYLQLLHLKHLQLFLNYFQ